MNVSKRERNRRANTGEAPPVEIAICTGLRSMIEGTMKLHKSGASTTLTGIPLALANSETWLLMD